MTPETQQDDADETGASGKGRATPSRREREAANKRPLVQDGGRAVRERQRAEQERAREGMARGEEKYLPVRDKGPQRRYVRDFVDARWSVGELVMPVLVIVILTGFIPNVWVNTYSIFLMFGILILTVLDSVMMGFQLRKRLSEKFGADRLQSNYGWYAAMRSIQLKPLRMPKPQVKRGAYPA